MAARKQSEERKKKIAVCWVKGMCHRRIIPIWWTKEQGGNTMGKEEKKRNSIWQKLWIKSTLSRFTEYPPEILKPTN